jgi:hypothetical protein
LSVIVCLASWIGKPSVIENHLLLITCSKPNNLTTRANARARATDENRIGSCCMEQRRRATEPGEYLLNQVHIWRLINSVRCSFKCTCSHRDPVLTLRAYQMHERDTATRAHRRRRLNAFRSFSPAGARARMTNQLTSEFQPTIDCLALSAALNSGGGRRRRDNYFASCERSKHTERFYLLYICAPEGVCISSARDISISSRDPWHLHGFCATHPFRS